MVPIDVGAMEVALTWDFVTDPAAWPRIRLERRCHGTMGFRR